ncbi:MAG: DUF262 domain-containing protein [Planctomycetota bacterium]
MDASKIYPNTDYQRSDKVWPAAARSYLIDTILTGYPIPKLSLSQKTDLKSRKTVKEIVDGQQRSQAILDFYHNNFRLSSKSDFGGKTYEKLDDDKKQLFLDYPLSVDLFTNATDADIRQVFRRINSYTVPLNPQEQRHARFQGPFKWFIVELASEFDQSLVDLGVVSERQISRMRNTQLFAEIVMCTELGITTYSKKKIDDFYDRYDDEFADETKIWNAMVDAFELVLSLRAIQPTVLMKSFLFYSLTTAAINITSRFNQLDAEYPIRRRKKVNLENAERNLSVLADAIESEKPPQRFTKLHQACSEATNTANNRRERFRWCCKALEQATV